MLSALPSALAAMVDITSGPYVGASVEFEVTCLGVFAFADGA